MRDVKSFAFASDETVAPLLGVEQPVAALECSGDFLGERYGRVLV